MAEVTAGQFFEAMRQLNDKIDTKHTSMHNRLDDHFNRLDQKLERHERDDLDVAKRVTVIETERKDEQQQAVKRSVWTGILAAAGMTGLMDAAKHFLSK